VILKAAFSCSDVAALGSFLMREQYYEAHIISDGKGKMPVQTLDCDIMLRMKRHLKNFLKHSYSVLSTSTDIPYEFKKKCLE